MPSIKRICNWIEVAVLGLSLTAGGIAFAAESALKPVKVFSDIMGFTGYGYTLCSDNDMGSGWMPDMNVNQVPVAVQFFFDSQVTITSVQIAQGSTDKYAYKKLLRTKDIRLTYSDGFMESIKCKDTSAQTSYAIRKKSTYFIEVEFLRYFDSTEDYTFLMREITFYGTKGTKVIPQKQAAVAFLQYKESMEKIFVQGGDYKEFPFFNQQVEWRVFMPEIKNADELMFTPFTGGDLDDNGALDEDYRIFAFVEYSEDKTSGLYDASFKLKDRLEWTKAKKCWTERIWFTISGTLIKPMGNSYLILSDAIITKPKFDELTEEPLPVPDVKRDNQSLPEVEQYIMETFDLPFYVFLQHEQNKPKNRDQLVVYVLSGRPGKAQGEWQPLEEEYDAEEFRIVTGLYLGSLLEEKHLSFDLVKFDDWELLAADCKKLYALDKNGADYEELLKTYRKLVARTGSDLY